MFPEAGGSSSFARRAFNEFWSFFAAWAGMLTYTVTIAISAFFVPHYIGGVFAFADALRTSPGDIIAAVRRDLAARRGQRVRREGVDRDQRDARGRRLPHAAAAGLIGAVLVLARDAGRQRARSASRPSGATSSSPSRSACSPTRGSRRSRTWPRRPRTRSTRSRRRSTACGSRCSRSTSRCRRSRCRRCRCTQRRRGVPDAARPDRGGGRLRRRPGARRRQAAGPRDASRTSPRSTSACSPRRSCSWPRTPASSASRGSCTRWASTARCPTRCGACTRASARLGSASSCSRSPRSC